MVKYRKHGLRMAELWLDQPIVRPAHCDVLLLQQYSQVPDDAYRTRFHSLKIDLTLSEDEVMRGLNRNTMYEVRRSKAKDGVECVHDMLATDQTCEAFRNFYDEFAKAKELPLTAMNELLARAADGALRFSRAMRHGAPIVWHVHAVTRDGVSLLHSASLFRQSDDGELRTVIGRANRQLHWCDMLFFKAEGKRTYDFGGWYAGSEDQDLLRVNQFKEGFGGTRVDQFNAGLPLSWRGSLYLRLRDSLSTAQRKKLSVKLGALLGRSR